MMVGQGMFQKREDILVIEYDFYASLWFPLYDSFN
jgi:hypothetical protein